MSYVDMRRRGLLGLSSLSAQLENWAGVKLNQGQQGKLVIEVQIGGSSPTKTSTFKLRWSYYKSANDYMGTMSEESHTATLLDCRLRTGVLRRSGDMQNNAP